MKNGKGSTGRSALMIVRKFFPQVKEVEDATKPIEIEVTAKNDKTGRKLDHSECALARACQEKLDIDGVVISISKAYLIKGTKAKRYELNEAAAREIVSFDRGAGFEPGIYALTVPEKTNRLGHQRGGTATNPGTGKPRVRAHRTGGIRAHLGSNKI